MKLKAKGTAKFVLGISFLCLGLLCFTSFSKENRFNPTRLRYHRSHVLEEASRERDYSSQISQIEPRLLSHPFDNQCQFPIHSIYPTDLSHALQPFRTSERLRTLQCAPEYPYSTQDSQGYIYIHPHYTHYPNVTNDVECKIVIIEGGLRNKTTNTGKNDFKEVETFQAPENTRLWVNADAFYVRCFNIKNKTQSWEKAYAGMRDETRTRNKIFPMPDLPSFDNFGGVRTKPEETRSDRYSIDILGFDSTSRTSFYRHMPRTGETMHRLGFEVFYGYNKVADNSMVNLGPILVGDVPQALREPRLDASGDISSDWILPANQRLDPTELQFLWKWMNEKYGCKSMFNEDISMKGLGLFNYPANEFQPGFTENPATHYYRAFYLAVYKNWKYGPCRNGVQIQRQFVELWSRFATQYKNVCHFGFTFVTTLTHETPFLLELLDEYVSSQLEHLEVTGALDNTLQVIMGDHGNRIGLIQYSYSGRIEERMPLMAIRLPTNFKKLHPQAWRNFQNNKYRLTSNFDVHQMLRDVAEMDFEPKRTRSGRGISLFDEVPVNRTCFDAYIPENFCTCLIDRSNLTETVRKLKPKSAEHVKMKSLEAIRTWIDENSLNNCLNSTNMRLEGNITTLGLNSLARHGLRNKANVTLTEQTRAKAPPMDYLHHQIVVSTPLRHENNFSVHLEFRIDAHQSTDEFVAGIEPAVRLAPVSYCDFLSIFDVCKCLDRYGSSIVST